MCIFCISFALGIGNCAWVVQSEVRLLDAHQLPLYTDGNCCCRCSTRTCAPSETASQRRSTGPPTSSSRQHSCTSLQVRPLALFVRMKI
jgi:hypothetical protein